jgi:hypothetical protein
MNNIQTSRTSIWKMSAVTILLAACSGQSNSKLADSAHFQPVPANKTSVEARLSRYNGQTEFLNVETSFGGPMFAKAASAESAGGSRSARAVQEADVFKVGKPGSNLLFLLNNHRGLQVVSFAKGAAQPELLGRVEATGNYPDSMYFQTEQDRLIVVERVWTNDDGQQVNWQEQKSRVLAYDVSTPSKPVLEQQVEFTGEAADSRMVGDVLYVAVSVHPEQNRWNTNDQKPEGRVYAFKLADKIEQVADQKLALPTYRENMNIVEIANDDSTFSYYLVATLSNSTWGWWWDRSSAVEVIDISSEEGTIKPLMIAPIKGNILERSSTQIKNNTLIVVSNYMSDEGTQRQRVAVETYKFPTGKKSEELSSDEVKFRKMFIERELKNAVGLSKEELAAKKAALESDSKLGLKGLFERTEAGNLEKILADSVVTVGDTTGQHASLQDVRFDGNMLYAFWVPANFIDPLDIFDISKPEDGIAHIAHLEFEGWIERSFPITFKGKNYILGLGTIVPSTNNESGVRHPQARLIEIRKLANGKVKAIDVADLTLKDSRVWSQLNGDDKAVELNWTNAEEGQGSVLFRVDQYSDREWVQGGKLVHFDLSKAETSDVFEEGSLLKAEWGWLKRVFTNKEINKINTFSDQELRVYEGQGQRGEVAKAIGMLELAREIKGFVTLNDKQAVQIVAKGGNDWMWNAAAPAAKTELRLVSAARADAELAQTFNVLELAGGFVSQMKTEAGLLVLTQKVERTTVTENGETRQETMNVFNLSLVKENGKRLETLATSSLVAAPNFDEGMLSPMGLVRRRHSYATANLLRTDDGKIFLSASGELHKVETANQSVNLTKVSIDGLTVENARNKSVQLIDGQLVLTWNIVVDADGNVAPVSENETSGRFFPRRHTTQYVAQYAAMLTEKDGTLSAGKALNIPGSLVSINGDRLMTNDIRLIDTVVQGEGENKWTNHIVRNILTSLVVVDAGASLRDMYDPSGDSESRWSNILSSLQPMGKGVFTFIEEKSWEDNGQQHTFSTLTTDSEGRILKQSKVVDLGMPHARLAQLEQVNGEWLGVLTSGRQMQLVRFASVDARPELLKLRKVGVNFEAAKATDVVALPGYSWYGTDIEFGQNGSNTAINFVLGLEGVAQVLIAK